MRNPPKQQPQFDPVLDDYEEPRRKPRASGYRRQPYIRETASVAPKAAIEEIDLGRSPAHAKLIQQTDFQIFDLPRPFAMPPGLEVAPFDEYDWETGQQYESILEARTPSLATRGVFPSLKDDRVLQALSMGEFAIQFALMFHPYVVDIREQYPYYTDEAYLRALAAGKKMNRSDLLTFDLVLTYWHPKLCALRYHIVSVKHARHVLEKKDRDREMKERALGAGRYWTWEMLRSNAIPRRELGNYAAMWSMAKSEKVRHLYEPSRRLADELMARSVRGSMESVLERRARSMGIGTSTAVHLFVSAVSHGFVSLDHSKRVDARLPIPLAA
ncbi:TnsA endonuclease N-terminal domain-containing protein [Burkholderia ubonensis]|uniref:TnsA endonuclease N-terminal domain-containing protein n=1 Tax=Burkholderia ubonensis TaxID=101571 RepID=UPI000BA5DEA2|nr:TnsA endonuclease N-terminal domain-containing protein [Burkholderia ubonensis]RQP28933.1 hypothetical protein DF155_26215 [Burkholderia ubonensis]RQP31860.1 hypothetical protein DF154_28475 [Burkholderia ubonensis]RQP34367.1 hypothetical protein DF156_27015 [Burkholderia ubonensis]RQP49411.1 hypothetical protein DF144_25170 [Burkholderia ubonensis]RQP53418.1 hypothetical protein DF151_26500 [Burkholderia ubonensis]